jgi:hypothetical protein
MTPEQEQALSEHIKAIAKILYEDTQENAKRAIDKLGRDRGGGT